MSETPQDLLLEWTDRGMASIQSHPQFRRAVRQSARDKADLFANESAFHRYALDRGYSLLSIFATCLHFSETGLTLTALKAMAQESKAASPGRVSSFIAMMRKIGAIAVADQMDDRRVHKMIVTQPFLRFMQERARIDTAALALMSPLGQRGLQSFENPAFFPAIMRAGVMLMRGGVPTSEGSVIEFFSERHMGLHVMHDIMGQHEEVLDGLPATISVSALSKRFGVSRAHVLKLFRDAAKAGLLVWDPDARSLTFSEKLSRRLLYYFAVILMGAAAFVTIALASPEMQAGESESHLLAAK